MVHNPPTPTSSSQRYLGQLKAEVAVYHPDQREEMLQFRRAMYGQASIFGDDAYLRWMYEQPALQSPAHIALWLYQKRGLIKGQQGGIRTRLKIGSTIRDALWMMDLMVEPQWRMRGIGAVLADVASHETDVAMTMEISAAARQAFQRAGWSDLGTVPLYMRPLCVTPILQTYAHRHVATIAGHVGTGVYRIEEAVGHMSVVLSGLKIEEVTRFDQRVNTLWDMASRDYPVICRRDCAFLNWRFADFPQRDRYRRFLILHANEVVGYAVLRNGTHHGLRAGFIVDFLCAPRWTYGLLGLCLRYFRKTRCEAVYCLHLNPVASAAFTAHGFFRRDSGFPWMVQASRLSAEARTLVTNPRNWFITAGDCDVDRPREGVVIAGD